MKIRPTPTPGFWLLVSVGLLVLLFFLWGFSTPRLEKVWDLEVGLKTGKVLELSNSEKNLFYRVFEDYPKYTKDLSGLRGIDLVSANSDGLALTDSLLIVRTKAAAECRHFELDVSGARSEFPMVFAVKGKTWSKEARLTQSGRSVVELPKGVPVPEFIEVKRVNKKDSNSSVDVKVRFCD